ncbi:translocation/assembly module TamB domain-containing protein [bacterium SCSIO 12741]|nr:translocation/assembly module TamB domain-containing protein [bacterium SCSIO 12741]
MGGLVVILLLVYLALLATPVQTWLANKVLTNLAESHGVTWRAGEVDIKPVSEIRLKDVYIEDLRKDTLLYASELVVLIDDFNLDKSIFDLEKVELYGARFFLKSYEGDTVTNLQFIIDQFTSTDTSSSAAPQISIAETQIEDLKFVWWDYNDSSSTQGIDFAHIDVSAFATQIQNFEWANEEIKADIQQLSFQERSGFTLNSLHTQFAMLPQEMVFDELLLTTPATFVRGDYRMKYDQFADFANYIEKVKMVAHLDSAQVNGGDIAYFSDALLGLNAEVSMGGQFTGTVEDFSIRDLDLGLGSQTRIRGDLMMKGLPDIEQTRISLDLDPSEIRIRDLLQIPLPPFDQQKHLTLPKEVLALQKVKVQGKFKGTYNHFHTDLALESPMGAALAKLAVHEERSQIPGYEGFVAVKKLNVGKLLGNEQVGLLSAQLDIKGHGITLETLETEIKGSLDRFDFSGYSYRGGEIDAELKKGWFDGDFTLNDELAELDFSGQINFNSDLPRFQFQLDVDTLYPVALNLIDRDSSAFFSAILDVDFQGFQPDNLSGKALLRELKYSEEGKIFKLDELKGRAFTVQGIPQIEFRSSAIRGIFKGTATPGDLQASFLRMMDHSLPSLVDQHQEEDLDFIFSAYLEIFDLNDLLAIFVPELSFDEAIKFRARYNTEKDIVRLEAEVPQARYQGYSLDTFEFELFYQDSAWEQQTRVQNIHLDEDLTIRNFVALGNANRDSVDLQFQFLNISQTENSSDIRIHGRVLGPEEFRFQVDSSEVVVADSVWSIPGGNQIHIDGREVVFKNLKGSSGEKFISLNGEISKRAESELVALFKGLNLSNFNRITGFSEAQLSGHLTGEVTLQDVYNNALLHSDLDLKNFYLNGESIGSGRLLSSWETEWKRLKVYFDLSRPAPLGIKDTIHSVLVHGYYYPNSSDTSLQLKVRSDGLELRAVQPFVAEYMDELKGKIHGELDLKGNLEHPELSGYLTLDSGRLQVSYLKVPYHCHQQTLQIKPDSVIIDNFVVLDKYDHEARVDGWLTHKNWQNLRYQVDVTPHNFMVLNTTSDDNSLYYGVAFLDTGASKENIVQIFGAEDSLGLTVKSNVVNESKFYIPLYTADEVSKTGYITFVQSSLPEEEKMEKEPETDLTGISIEFDINVDPSTEVQLIFDETTGDILKSVGGGNIQMDINSSGDFEMFGTYEVRDGSYMFTYENLFSKRFKIQRGSQIIWNGDPFNAQLNMTAVYRVKAPLGDILGDSTMTRKVDNECLMILTKNLAEPDIDFDIRIRNVDSEIESQVKSQMPTQDDVTKQVFSLLLFNRYSPPESNYSGGGLASSTGSELLTNQINNWLSKMDNSILEVGFSELKKDNVEVALSKNLLNDRLKFESNVGVNNSETNTSQNQFVGDFTLEYLIKEDGKVRAKVFNRTSDYSIENQNSSSQTQGIGIFYQEDFNTIGEFLHKVFGKKTPEEKAQKEAEKALQKERQEERKKQNKEDKEARKKAREAARMGTEDETEGESNP